VKKKGESGDEKESGKDESMTTRSGTERVQGAEAARDERASGRSVK
jgi:hypothetical protein